MTDQNSLEISTAVEAMTVADTGSESSVLSSTVNTMLAADVLQPVDGNQGGPR